ncbi:hypothetical protein [Nonlabens ulvanivorans]|uniref:hypothetical protein n=1 Tax=Nonlabens ulvanivorans TaxID=906888 RepID=UPI0037C9DF87
MEESPNAYRIDHVNYVGKKFHAIMFGIDSFQELPPIHQIEALIDYDIIELIEDCENEKMFEYEEEILSGIKEIDLLNYIPYRGHIYHLRLEIIEELWIEFYTSHQHHPFEQATKNEINSNLVRRLTKSDKLEYINSKMESIDVFNLDKLIVKFNNDIKEVYFEGCKERITTSFSNERFIAYLSGEIGGFLYINNEYESLYSNDLAKFRVYKYLEYLAKNLTTEEYFTANDESDNFDAFESVYLLDKLGVFTDLERKGFTKERSYEIVSRLTGKSKPNIKSQYLRLDKSDLPEKLALKAVKMDNLFKL